uniref:ANK_REP_REGION domain-containing protein n=1 Tax=Macrostomum lignano TaxID=282301 RepID=A0A1I8F6N2_9PLAT
NGWSPLLIASDCGREGIVQILLKKHARVDVFRHEQGVLHTAATWPAQEGHNEVVKLLLKQDGVEVDARTLAFKRRAPLHLAAQRGPQRGLRDPCRSQCRHKSYRQYIVTLASAKGMTCAHIAASKGSISVINELLRSNRSLLCTGKIKTNGCTALHLAAQEGHEKVVRLLVEAGGVAVRGEL